MAGQHSSEDDIAYFAAGLGRTCKIEVSSSPAQTSDDEGALAPGRYLLHVSDIEPASAKVWVKTTAFKKGQAASMLPDVPAMPLQYGVVVAIEVNVRKGDGDRVMAVMQSGTANLFITQISRPL